MIESDTDGKPRPSRRTRTRGTELVYVPHDYFRPIDLAEVFPVAAPIEIDLGCGDGSFLVAMARANPATNYLGTERLHGRVRATCWKADVAGVKNLRVLRIESAYALKYLFPAESISRCYVLFPDPWPKRRHWPRRLIQQEFLQSVSTVLRPAGELCIKTDDADYFSHVERLVSGCGLFTRHPWNEEVPRTDFERHYVAQGRVIQSMRLVKR